MSVERARELVERLASDSTFASQIEAAGDRAAMRNSLNQAGYSDVSEADMLQVVATDVLTKIYDARASGSTDPALRASDPALERAWLLGVLCSGGGEPSVLPWS